MNYSDIKSISLSYADREDNEVISRMDQFIEIVEARVNRQLRVFKMSIRASLPLLEADGEEYYGLPDDFGGIRDIQINNEGNRCTLKYMSPEQLNNESTAINNGVPFNQVYYTLIASQIQLSDKNATGTLEVIYYQKLIPLSDTDPVNWLSQYNPDCYIFGILVEISSFVKDATAAGLWNERFMSCITEIEREDGSDRWSGTALQARIG